MSLAAAGPLSVAADEAPTGSSTTGNEEPLPGPQIIAGGKTDRLPEPAVPKPPPAVEDAASAMVDSLSSLEVEERIEQAFADLPQPAFAPRLNLPWAPAAMTVGLGPATAASDLSTDLLVTSSTGQSTATPLGWPADAGAALRRLADAASVFSLPPREAERARRPQEPLGGGYLAALAPPEHAMEALPADSDAAAMVPLPEMPGEIPVPTPRPADAPVASLTPQAPARQQASPTPPEAQPKSSAKAPAKPAATSPQSAGARPAAPDRRPSEEQPSREPRPRLPASLLPTRPPAE